MMYLSQRLQWERAYAIKKGWATYTYMSPGYEAQLMEASSWTLAK